jgi:hypothetical protein
MNIVANFALQPFLFVDVDGDRGVSTFRDPAAAPGIAVSEVSAVLNNVEGPPIGPNNALAMWC